MSNTSKFDKTVISTTEINYGKLADIISARKNFLEEASLNFPENEELNQEYLALRDIYNQLIQLTKLQKQEATDDTISFA